MVGNITFYIPDTFAVLLLKVITWLFFIFIITIINSQEFQEENVLHNCSFVRAEFLQSATYLRFDWSIGWFQSSIGRGFFIIYCCTDNPDSIVLPQVMDYFIIHNHWAATWPAWISVLVLRFFSSLQYKNSVIWICIFSEKLFICAENDIYQMCLCADVHSFVKMFNFQCRNGFL